MSSTYLSSNKRTGVRCGYATCGYLCCYSVLLLEECSQHCEASLSNMKATVSLLLINRAAAPQEPHSCTEAPEVAEYPHMHTSPSPSHSPIIALAPNPYICRCKLSGCTWSPSSRLMTLWHKCQKKGNSSCKWTRTGRR